MSAVSFLSLRIRFQDAKWEEKNSEIKVEDVTSKMRKVGSNKTRKELKIEVSRVYVSVYVSVQLSLKTFQIIAVRSIYSF